MSCVNYVYDINVMLDPSSWSVSCVNYLLCLNSNINVCDSY
jgi:hypothetical protein